MAPDVKDEMLPIMLVKVGAALWIAAQATARFSLPVSGIETLVGFIGGLFGGVLLLRASGGINKTHVDRAFTVLLSGGIGASIGPHFVNYLASHYGWMNDGIWENLGGGAMTGGLFPPIYAFFVALMISARQNPGSLSDFVGGFFKAIWRSNEKR